VTVADTDLVVASDDDDTDASLATLVDRVDHLLARGIQHANNTNESRVCLQPSNDVSKGKLLYSAVFNPQDRLKCFTLYSMVDLFS